MKKTISRKSHDTVPLMMYNMSAPQRIVTKSLYRTDQLEYSIQGTCFSLILQVTIVGPRTLRLGGYHDDVCLWTMHSLDDVTPG